MKIPLREYWRLLNRYLVAQRGAALWMAALLLVNTGLGLAAPQVVRSFIDAALAGESQSTLIRTAIGFFIVKITHQVMNLWATYRVQQVAWTATNALRIDLVAHLLRLDLDFHKTHPSGELIERVDGDVDTLSAFLSSFIVDLIGGSLLLVGILVVIFIEDTFLGILFLFYALLSILLLSWVHRFAPPHWRKERVASASFWGFMGEMLTATEDIQACGAVQYVLRRFLQQWHVWRTTTLRANMWRMIWLATSAVFVVGVTLAWGVGGPMVQAGGLSLGTLYMIVQYLTLLVWHSIQDIQWRLQELQRAGVSIARVGELLSIKSNLVDGTCVLPPGALSIRFNDVSFSYSDTRVESAPSGTQTGSFETSKGFVLKDITFRLQPGRVLGLMGRTGSGKTTIARLLFRLYDPQEGEITLGDVDLRQVQRDALRSRTAMVTQDVQLFHATLRDNLTFFDRAVSDEKLITTLETLGLTAWLDRQPLGLDSPISGETLSAGEAQLVALSRVFLKNPNLVILDEASSRLDPATEILLGHVLDRLLEGRSAVIIAHRLQTLDRVNDILILEQGQVIEYGSRDKLAADDTSHYSRLLSTGFKEVLV